MKERTLQLHLVIIRLAKGMLGSWEYWVKEQLTALRSSLSKNEEPPC